MRKQTFIIAENGNVRQHGVNYGPGNDVLTLHHESKDTLVFKWKGHTGWAGLGQQKYYPTQFMVVRKLRDVLVKNERHVEAEEVVTFEVRK